MQGFGCLVLSREKGGMGTTIGGFYRDYHRDPFPHSLLRTRQLVEGRFRAPLALLGCRV